MNQNDWLKNATIDMLPEAHQKLAEVIGVEATFKLCNNCGGLVIYIPVMETVYTTLRIQMVRKEYTGSNTTQLARRYGLSARTIQRFVADLKAQKI